MLFTQTEKDNALKELNIDPAKWDLSDDGAITKKVSVQPSISEEPTTLDNVTVKPSQLGSLSRSAARSVAPTFTGGAAAAATMGALNLMAKPLLAAGPVGWGINLALPLVSALVVGGATKAAQDELAEGSNTMFDPAVEALDIETNPWSSLAGGIITAPAGGMSANGKNVVRAGRTLLGKTVGGVPTPVLTKSGAQEFNALIRASEDINLANVGLGAGLGAGISAGSDIASDISQDRPIDIDWGTVGAETAAGALFNKPNTLGRKIFKFPDVPEIPEIGMRTSDLKVLQEAIGKPQQEVIPEGQQEFQFEAAPKTDKTPFAMTPEVIADLAGRGFTPEQIAALPLKQVRAIFNKPKKAAKEEGGQAVYQEEASGGIARTPAEQLLSDELKAMNLSRQVENPEAFVEKILAFAKLRGITTKFDAYLQNNAGDPVAGRAFIKDIINEGTKNIVSLNPEKMGIDTSYHEGFHQYFNYLRKSESPSEIALYNGARKLVADSPEFKAYAEQNKLVHKNEAQRLDLAEEFLTQDIGNSTLGRMLQVGTESTPGKQWWVDFKRAAKNKFKPDEMSYTEMRDFLTQRFMGDNPYDVQYAKHLSAKPPMVQAPAEEQMEMTLNQGADVTNPLAGIKYADMTPEQNAEYQRQIRLQRRKIAHGPDYTPRDTVRTTPISQRIGKGQVIEQYTTDAEGNKQITEQGKMLRTAAAGAHSKLTNKNLLTVADIEGEIIKELYLKGQATGDLQNSMRRIADTYVRQRIDELVPRSQREAASKSTKIDTGAKPEFTGENTDATVTEETPVRTQTYNEIADKEAAIAGSQSSMELSGYDLAGILDNIATKNKAIKNNPRLMEAIEFLEEEGHNPIDARQVLDDYGFNLADVMADITVKNQELDATTPALKPSDLLDYSPEDLASYKSLKEQQVQLKKDDRIVVNGNLSPEWQKNWIDFETLRNKYNGNPPKNLNQNAEATTPALKDSLYLIGPEVFDSPMFKRLPDKLGTYNIETVKARLGKLVPPLEMELYNKAGLNEFLSTGRKTKEELVKWMRENAPQAKLVTYGMKGQVSQAKRALDSLRHNWFDNLKATEKHTFDDVLNQGRTLEQWLEQNNYVDSSKNSKWMRENAEKYVELTKQTANEVKESYTKPAATTSYEGVSVFPTSEAMPDWTVSKSGKNVQRVDVVIPDWTKRREGETIPQLQARLKAGGGTGTAKDTGVLWQPDNLHENLPNTLGWAMIQYKTGPKGEKIAVIVEAQSRWGQSRREEEALWKDGKVTNTKKESDGRYYNVVKKGEGNSYIHEQRLDDTGYKGDKLDLAAVQKHINEHSKELASEVGRVADHPLLKDYNRLILKAAIEQAKKEGATHIMVSDAETAMMTEGHDTNLLKEMPSKEAAENYEKANTEISGGTAEINGKYYVMAYPGKFTEAYRQGFRSSQEKGMRQNYDNALPDIAAKLTNSKGERVSLGEHKNAFEKATEDWNAPVADKYKRKNLIFKNADGTPKTDVSGMMFPLDNAPDKFSLAHTKYQESSATESAIDIKLFNSIKEERRRNILQGIPISADSRLDALRLKYKGDPDDLSLREPRNLEQLLSDHPARIEAFKKNFEREENPILTQKVKKATTVDEILKIVNAQKYGEVESIVEYEPLIYEDVVGGLLFDDKVRVQREGIKYRDKIVVRAQVTPNTTEYVGKTIKPTYDHFKKYQEANSTEQLDMFDVSKIKRDSGMALLKNFDSPQAQKIAARLQYDDDMASLTPKGDDGDLYGNWAIKDQPYGILAGITADVDRIHAIEHKDGKTVADAATKFYEQHRFYKGQLLTDVLQGLKKHVNFTNPKQLFTMDTPEMRNVVNYLFDMHDRKSSPIKLTPTEIEIEKTVRANLLKSLGIKNSIPTLRSTKTANSTYLPHVPSRKVLDTLLNKPGSAESQALIKDWHKYYTTVLGKSMGESQAAFDTFWNSYGKRGSTLAEKFGPIDDAAGLGLPRAWRETQLIDIMSRFNNRFARRIAYEQSFNNNPSAIAALKNTEGVANSDVVKRVMDNINGDSEHEEAKRNAISGLVRAGMFGPLTGAKDFVANFTIGWQHMDSGQTVSSVVDALANLKDNYKASFENGINRENISALEFGDGGIEASVQFARRLRDVLSTVQGRNKLEQFTRAIAMGQGRYLVKDNLAKWKAGKLNSQNSLFLDKFMPDYKAAKLTQQHLDDAAARYVESVQGTYDYRGLPHMAVEGSWAPILSLARWNIEKMNNFRKHVIAPAKKGNFKPFLMQTIGMIIGGAAVEKLVEEATQRKSKLPTKDELVGLAEEGNYGGLSKALTYKMMGMASLAGYGGAITDMARIPTDVIFKNRPQEYNNPTVWALTSMYDHGKDLVEAMQNDDLEMSTEQVTQIVGRIMTDYLQTARLASAFTDPERREELANADKLRDLKIWKATHGQPLPSMSTERSNPYLNEDIKKFKKETDIEEIKKQIPELIRAALAKSNGDPEALRRELLKIKMNSYQTIPNPKTMPRSFLNYVEWLKRTQGEAEAEARLSDYIKRNSINSAKTRAIP